MTQQKYVLQVTRVIAIVELASNKIQPVPKKNALNSKIQNKCKGTGFYYCELGKC